jgi:hypothetical protein
VVFVPIAAVISLVLAPGTASAATGQRWDVINVSKYSDVGNPGGPVASCRNPGSTCTLSVTESVSTTIQSAFGYSQSGVAAQLSFAYNRSVSTGASCTSPKLKSGQKYVAYRLGTQAMYKIRHTTYSQFGTKTETSGWLFSWEPYTGAHIDCHVVSG